MTCCVADFLAMVVADTPFHARQAAATGEGRLRGARADHRSVRARWSPARRWCTRRRRSRRGRRTCSSRPRPSRAATWTRRWPRPRTSSRRRSTRSRSTSRSSSPKRAWPCRSATASSRSTRESQGSVYDHAQIARLLNLDPARVEIALAASGGAFGAKEELSIQAQTAMAAHLLQRPVKTVLTRPQSTQHHVKRHAMTVTLTVGADARGPSARAALAHRRGCRRLPHDEREVRAPRRVPLARRVPHSQRRRRGEGRLHEQSERGAMRGFGSNQAQFAMEGVMDILAERVGVDGWDIRDRNILNPGRRVRHRPDHARERPRHPRDARGRQGRLQEARSTRASAAASRAPASATARSKAATSPSASSTGARHRDSQRLHGNGPGRLHRDDAGRVRGDRSSRPTS